MKTNLPAGVKTFEAPGIHNTFVIADKIYSGSSPEGDEAYAALAKLGIKTLISVDGTKPDVAAAKKYGMTYVHLPHGYDGISTNTANMLVKAAETLPGPIFVHCHHGKHRGPTAVAVICVVDQGWTPTQAEEWLKAAGTASNYEGLYRTAREYKAPSAAVLKQLPDKFPETTEVSGLVDAMVEIDTRWDNLKEVRKAGYQTPKQSPDVRPVNEATLLWEHFRETQRLPEAKAKGAEFLKATADSEASAQTLRTLLEQYVKEPKEALKPELDRTFDAVAKSCVTCHKSFRDKKP